MKKKFLILIGIITVLSCNSNNPIPNIDNPDPDPNPDPDEEIVFSFHPKRPVVGMYYGWGQIGIDKITEFENKYGIEVQLGHDFGDRTRWDWFTNEKMVLDPWAKWVAAKPGRRFSFSMPLLPVNGDVDMNVKDTQTIKQKYEKLASGAYDSYFAIYGKQFQNRPALRDAIIRLGWEMNGTAWPWSIPPNDPEALEYYKKGFARAVKAMRSECPTLQFEWCPNCQKDYSGYRFEEMYPGDDVVDFVGIGLYDYYWPGGNPSDATRWKFLKDGEYFFNGLADQVALAKSKNKRLAHTEYGLWPTHNSGGGGDHPWFIRQLAFWWRQNDYAYQIYNNVVTSLDHRLETYPNSLKAYLETAEADEVADVTP